MFRLLIVALAALLGTEIFAQIPATIVYPDDEDRCVPDNPTLEWGNLGNVRYRLIVSESSDLSNPIVDTTDIRSNDSEYFFYQSQPNTTYYWAVTSFYQPPSTAITYTDTVTFTTKRESNGSVFPMDGDVCIELDNTLRWNTVNGALSYSVQISESPNFSSTVLDRGGILVDTLDFMFPKNDFVYYYRTAYFYNDNSGFPCRSDWSDPVSFRTQYAAPVVGTPEDNAVGLDTITTIIWARIQNALFYDIEIDDNSDFSSPEITEQVATADYIADLPQLNTVYYARVRAGDAQCLSEWSDTRTFRTRYDSIMGITPSDSSECIKINDTFVWSMVPETGAYTVQVSEDPNFGTLDREVKNITDTTAIINSPNSIQRYFWRVRAEDAENRGPWSPVLTYETTSVPPTPITPADEEDDVTLDVTFEWDNLDPASNFGYQIATDSNFTTNSIIFEDPLLFNKVVALIMPEYNTTYYWRVKSSFATCESGYSDFVSFMTVRGWPDLLTPSNQTSNVNLEPLLEWSQVKGADFYDLEYSTDSNFPDSNTVKLYELQNLGYRLLNLTDNTTYFWRLRTKNQFGVADWSPAASFTTGVADPDAVRLINPARNSSAVAVDVDFIWSKVANANLYDFQLSKSATFSTTIADQMDITDTTFTVSGLENNEDYYWRVRAKNNTTTANWSEAFRFRTVMLAPADAPMAIRPTDGQDHIDTLVYRFEWTKVDMATRYEFQVNTSDGFEEATMKSTRIDLIDPQVSVFDFPHSTEFFWRVRGANNGGVGPWSNTFQFTTFNPISVEFDYSKEFSISPNPVSTSMRVAMTEMVKDISSIYIVDSKGGFINIPVQLQSGSEMTIDLTPYNLSGGNYYLYIQGSDFKATLPLMVREGKN
ncbi:MAG: hypothetical protein Kapaf2KO_08820 [Candidatus Kapaibacteriales bacterium]